MNKCILAFGIVFSLFFVSSVSAECQLTTEVALGYRSNEVDWRINEDTDCFQTSSRVCFRDVDCIVLTGRSRLIDTCWYFRVLADYGWVGHGHFRETLTFSPEKEQIPHSCGRAMRRTFSDDYILDATAAVGYPFFLGPDFFVFAPLVGYSYHSQCYEVEHKRRFFDLFDPRMRDKLPLTKEGFRGSKKRDRESTFTYRWYGPLVGFDLGFALEDCWSLYSEFEYHFAGKTKTKRRAESGFERFDNFDKTESSHGFSYVVGANYFFCGNWFTTVDVDYKWWRVGKSTNRITWWAWGINGSLGYIF